MTGTMVKPGRLLRSALMVLQRAPRPMATSRTIIVAVLLVATVGSTTAGTVGLPPGQLDVPQDRVLMQVDVGADGDAHWRISYRTDLDDGNGSEDFDAVRQRIERNPERFEQDFRRRMGGTVAMAENATLRQMAIVNLSVATRTEQLPRRTGVVTYEFGWRGFADGGETLTVADVLGGLELDEDTTLVIRWPERYEAHELVPEPGERRDRAAVWRGPATFAFDEPRIEARSPAVARDRQLQATAGGLIVLLPALLVGAVVTRRYGVPLRRRRRTTPSSEAPAAEREDSVAEEPADETAEPGEPGEPIDELASNEEQVLAALRARGGRAKQQDVVEDLGWTEAKTSQVVTAMHDGGAIDKYRLGRENVLALPGQDVTDTGGGGDET